MFVVVVTIIVKEHAGMERTVLSCIFFKNEAVAFVATYLAAMVWVCDEVL